MNWFPLPQAGGAAKLANLFASCSGVGNRGVAAHPQPLPQAGGEINGRNRPKPAPQILQP
ncbi:protein of unknown function [uncultured Sphingopyxis sp.]|uniref:Uncharacterized protein n=1 Tax=uncultured Sphingopyxis sp. TaxID=310581 RepID=A0A1Y5PUI2_9SPHN|nr:protein of unknown function [uncultured Sphingopyxis sp.]